MRYLAVVLLLLGASLGFLPCSAGAQDSPFIYHRDIGSSIIVAWEHDKDCSLAGEGYSFYTFQFQGLPEDSATDVRIQGQTPELQIPIDGAFEGRFHFKVRVACVNAETYYYSAYSDSADPFSATVDGAPRGWVVSYDLKPPTELVIESLP